MSSEKFEITQNVIYTIKSAHGNIECKGLKNLEAHVGNTLGAFVDRMTSERNATSGNIIKSRLFDHKFLIDNRSELETIYAMLDAVAAIKNPPSHTPDCTDFYCNRCGSSSEIEYTGN